MTWDRSLCRMEVAGSNQSAGEGRRTGDFAIIETLLGIGCYEYVRKWWNWQTHHLEGVAPKGVGVQIPPSAPFSRLESTINDRSSRSIINHDYTHHHHPHHRLFLHHYCGVAAERQKRRHRGCLRRHG